MSVGIPDNPLMSVVMPVYNAEPYVAEAIQSILAQTYPHFEFIIVDDGSTDGSAAIVRDFAARDARIRPLFVAHGGQSRTLNAAVAAAEGLLIAYMGADDLALPDLLAAQFAWMRRAGVDICGSCAKLFGAAEHLLWFPETHAAIRSELLFRCAMPHHMLMRANLAKAHLYDEQVIFLEYELWTRLVLHYRMGNVQQILYKYRQHPQQTSVVKQEKIRDEMRKYRHRYFTALFPEATAEDYAVLARVAEKEPLSSLENLERAGTWLLRLAQTPDRFLREHMARRWRAACRRSSHLGLGCYHLYQQMAPQFGLAIDEDVSELWTACSSSQAAGGNRLSTG